MHVELSDLLTCPRCGPGYGLILLPTKVHERRVETGVLGCANCRERYPVEGGEPDLRTGGVAGGVGAALVATGPDEVPGPDPEMAVRLAALLDLRDGGGTVLVAGPWAAHGSLLAELVPDIIVLVVGAEAEAVGVSATRLWVDARLPIRASGLRGVALTGGWSSLIEEGARLLRPAGRLILEPAPSDAEPRLAASGLAVLLNEAGVVVAGRGR